MIEENNRELLLKIQLIRIEFFEKHCKSCIGSKLQEERKCAKLRSNDFLSCKKKDRYIEYRIKETKKEIVKKEMNILLNHHSERSQSFQESRFTVDIFN